MNHLSLPWADKFRNLLNDRRLTDAEVLSRFLRYCYDQEVSLTTKWKKQNITEELI